MRRLCVSLVVVAAVFVTAAPALARQGNTASLRVTVLDETAAVLPGATLLLVGNDGVEHALQAARHFAESGEAEAKALLLIADEKKRDEHLKEAEEALAEVGKAFREVEVRR